MTRLIPLFSLVSTVLILCVHYVHFCESLRSLYLHEFVIVDFFSVGEDDEVSIKEAVDMIAHALGFKGKIHVSSQYSPMILNRVPINRFTCYL